MNEDTQVRRMADRDRQSLVLGQAADQLTIGISDGSIGESGPVNDRVADRLSVWLARHADIAAGHEREAEIDGLIFAAYGVDTEHAIGIARAVLGRAFG